MALNDQYGFVENKGNWEIIMCPDDPVNVPNGLAYFYEGRRYKVDAVVKVTSSGGISMMKVRDLTN